MHDAVRHLGEAIREQRMGGMLLFGPAFKLTFGLFDSPALASIVIIRDPMPAIQFHRGRPVQIPVAIIHFPRADLASFHVGWRIYLLAMKRNGSWYVSIK